mgnify:CR=1 FL=1
MTDSFAGAELAPVGSGVMRGGPTTFSAELRCARWALLGLGFLGWFSYKMYIAEPLTANQASDGSELWPCPLLQWPAIGALCTRCHVVVVTHLPCTDIRSASMFVVCQPAGKGLCT